MPKIDLKAFEAIKVTKKKRDVSIYSLCEGDLIEVKFKDSDVKKGARVRGLFVHNTLPHTRAFTINIQTARFFRSIPIEWIEEIKILLPFIEEGDSF